jgi:hypothetical protein
VVEFGEWLCQEVVKAVPHRHVVLSIPKDKITERMAVSPDDAWDVPGPGKPLPPDRTRKSEYTQFILDGKFDTSDVDGPWLKKFMKKYGLTEDDLKAGQ